MSGAPVHRPRVRVGLSASNWIALVGLALIPAGAVLGFARSMDQTNVEVRQALATQQREIDRHEIIIQRSGEVVAELNAKIERVIGILEAIRDGRRGVQ